jgi:hypothetical protein
MQQTNWTAIISTSLTVLVGLACLILALTLGKNNPTAAGMLFATAGTALGSFLKQPQKSGTDSDAPTILPKGPLSVLVLVVSFLSLVGTAQAQADGDHSTVGVPAVDGDHPAKGLGCVDASNTYCVVWSQALAWSLNLKDITAKSGSLLLGLSMQHRFGSLPLAAGVFAGLGASDQGKSYQACAGVSITNFGLVCVGAQRVRFDASGETAWQAVVNIALQVTSGSTPQ